MDRPTKRAIAMIGELKEEDVAPVIHAHWIKREYDDYSVGQDCSCCGKSVEYRYNYCPFCGAKMDEGDSKNAD